MIAHWDVVQGTEAWHRLRYRKITGTTASGLLVKSDTLLIKLLGEFTEPFELEDEGFVSPAMLRGKELEPQALKAISEYTGHNFLKCGFLQSEDNHLLGLSPDGITEDLRFMCELKSPGKTEHAKTLYNGVIPDDHLDQVLHCFTTNKYCERVYFGSFRPEHEYVPLFVRDAGLDTPIDMGTKAKPNVKQVGEWVDILKFMAKQVDDNLQLAINKLRSI